MQCHLMREGGREGGRERVREREGERDIQTEESTHTSTVCAGLCIDLFPQLCNAGTGSLPDCMIGCLALADVELHHLHNGKREEDPVITCKAIIQSSALCK